MAIYQRPKGRASITNPNYPFCCPRCRTNLHDHDYDSAMELQKGAFRADAAIKRGDLGKASDATGAALSAYVVPKSGVAIMCKCGWSYDLRADAFAVQAAVEELHSHLLGGRNHEATLAFKRVENAFGRLPSR
jgi:hypothetical protein